MPLSSISTSTSSSNDRLIHAYHYQIRKDDASTTTWNNKYQPQPCDNRATLWMTCNHSKSVLNDLFDFFGMMSTKHHHLGHFRPVRRSSQYNNNGKKERGERVDIIDSYENILLSGWMIGSDDNNIDNNSNYYHDANVGRYVILQANNEKGCALAATIVSLVRRGYAVILFHDKLNHSIDVSLRNECANDSDDTNRGKLMVTTGITPIPDIDLKNDKPANNSDNDSCNIQSISTKFELLLPNDNGGDDSHILQSERENKDVVAAYCLLSYNDSIHPYHHSDTTATSSSSSSFSSTMGPTIQSIVIHPKFRGKGLLPILWHWVKRFILDNFPLECLNESAYDDSDNDDNYNTNNETDNSDVKGGIPPCIMVKATNLIHSEIDVRIIQENDNNNNFDKDTKDDSDNIMERDSNGPSTTVSITDREFFHDYAGFSTILHRPMSLLSLNKGGEIAVVYLPLLPLLPQSSASSSSPLLSSSWSIVDNATLPSILQSMSQSSSPSPKIIPSWTEGGISGRRKCSCFKCTQMGKYGKVYSPSSSPSSSTTPIKNSTTKHTKRKNNQLLRCSRCKDVYYCSVVCQKKDWKYHKKWCGKSREDIRQILLL